MKAEILILLKSVRARCAVDQNAQVAAGGTCLLLLVLLYFFGLW